MQGRINSIFVATEEQLNLASHNVAAVWAFRTVRDVSLACGVSKIGPGCHASAGGIRNSPLGGGITARSVDGSTCCTQS